MADEPGNRVFQTLIVHIRTDKPDPKTGKSRAVAVGQINCNPDRCTRMSQHCRGCIDEAKRHGGPLIEDFLFREQFDNAGANHLRGDYMIPTYN